MDQVIAILQARMQSKRLPGKILADLHGRPLLARVIERLKATKGIDRIVLAVPQQEAPYLAPLAGEAEVEIHPGSYSNVLYRFYSAAQRFPSAYVVRATGDNPLIDTFMLARCIEECKSGQWDIVGCRNMPLGTSAEVFPASLLDILALFGRQEHHREHVTSYIYENENDFRIKRLEPPARLQAPKLRLTVDTQEDLALARLIYSNLYEPGKIIRLEKVIRFLNAHPEYVSINSQVRQRSWRSENLAHAVA
ncbi:MAG TPA: NTP transferase domain-containing protein [archaeon]|nr:NTP transferase domain-containing protein [archaeon]